MLSSVREKWGIFLFNFSGIPTTKGKHFDFPLEIRWRTIKQCWCFFPCKFKVNLSWTTLGFSFNHAIRFLIVQSLRFWVTCSGNTKKWHWNRCQFINLCACSAVERERTRSRFDCWLMFGSFLVPSSIVVADESQERTKTSPTNLPINQPTNQPTNKPADQPTNQPIYREAKVVDLFWKPRRKSIYLQASGSAFAYFASIFFLLIPTMSLVVFSTMRWF